MKLIMEGKNRSINWTHGSTCGDICSFVDPYPNNWYVKIRDFTSLLCGRWILSCNDYGIRPTIIESVGTFSQVVMEKCHNKKGT